MNLEISQECFNFWKWMVMLTEFLVTLKVIKDFLVKRIRNNLIYFYFNMNWLKQYAVYSFLFYSCFCFYVFCSRYQIENCWSSMNRITTTILIISIIRHSVPNTIQMKRLVKWFIRKSIKYFQWVGLWLTLTGYEYACEGVKIDNDGSWSRCYVTLYWHRSQ